MKRYIVSAAVIISILTLAVRLFGKAKNTLKKDW